MSYPYGRPGGSGSGDPRGVGSLVVSGFRLLVLVGRVLVGVGPLLV